MRLKVLNLHTMQNTNETSSMKQFARSANMRLIEKLLYVCFVFYLLLFQRKKKHNSHITASSLQTELPILYMPCVYIENGQQSTNKFIKKNATIY